MFTSPATEQDGAGKVSLQFWKIGYLDVTKTKRKQLYHNNTIYVFFSTTCSFLATGSKLYSNWLPSLLLPLLLFSVCSLTEIMPMKFQGSGEYRFGLSEKDRYFLKTPKWKHKLVWENKRGKLVSYFLDNAAKTCLYGSKISENIEIKHVFQPKAFFLLSNNLHTSQLSAFKASQIRLKKDVFFVTYLRCFNHISKRCLFCDVPETPPKISCKYYVTWEEDRFKCTIQITTHNKTQLFGQFDWKVECSFTN